MLPGLLLVVKAEPFKAVEFDWDKPEVAEAVVPADVVGPAAVLAVDAMDWTVVVSVEVAVTASAGTDEVELADMVPDGPYDAAFNPPTALVDDRRYTPRKAVLRSANPTSAVN